MPISNFPKLFSQLLFSFLATFTLYIVTALVVGGYLNWSIGAELQRSLANGGPTAPVDPTRPYAAYESKFAILAEVLSLHGYRPLKYDYGIPMLPGGLNDLLLNGLLLASVVSGIILLLIAPVTWFRQRGKQSSLAPLTSGRLASGTLATAPSVSVAFTSVPRASLKRVDLVGTAVLHFLATFVVVALLIRARLTSETSTVLESLFLLVQLPLTAVIYPLSWMNSSQINYGAALGVILANSVAASFCWHNTRALLAGSKQERIRNLPPVFWGLAWLLAGGIAFLGHRLPWESFQRGERIWWFITLYFLTTGCVLWLSLLLKRTQANDENGIFRGITAVMLVGLLAGTAQSSFRPISIFLAANDDSIETALLKSLKGGAKLGDEFLVVGELSAANTAEPRYYNPSGKVAQLDKSLPKQSEIRIPKKCYYRAEELAGLAEDDAAAEINSAVQVLRLTNAEVATILQKLRSELRDAAPSQQIDLEMIDSFVRRQQHCAMRRLTFFGRFASAAMPIVEALGRDPELTEQANITLMELRKP